jgi:hypothetical protein
MGESCCLKSIADLKALKDGAVPCLTLLGYYGPGDGGGSEFYWDPSSNEPDDRGTIIIPASNPSTGRWKRLVEGPFLVKFFGAKGDGTRVHDGAMLAGSNILTSLSGKFAPGDVGKDISVDGAGAVQDLITTIAQYISPTEVSLATAASTGVAGATVSVQDCTTPKTLGGGAMAVGSKLLTVQSGTFTPADVEEPIRVAGAGAPGPLYSLIGSFISPTQVRLNAVANTDTQNADVFWATDDTSAIQAAIEAAAARDGGIVFFPVGTFVVNGAETAVVAQPSRTYALALRSNITFSGAGRESILWLKDNSTGNSRDPQMFFAGPTGVLSNVVFEKLAFNGNSQHNLLGMACGIGAGSLGDDRNCCAIFISGLQDGEGVWLTGLTVQNCYFTNFPGANVIVVQDRRLSGSTFSSDVLIFGNTFYDNRKADGNRDHSTVNIFADNTRVIGNNFALPSNATDLQKQIANACELHGSASCFNHNTLSYYAGGPIFSENLNHDCFGQEAVGNVMSNHGYLGFLVEISGLYKTVKQINITGNVVHFGTVRALTNQTLLPYRIPFPKLGVIFFIGQPAVLDSLNVTGNTFDGDALNQAGIVAGVAGIWGGGGYWGLTHLNVCGNTFRRLAYGVWQDGKILTVAKHSTIVGNRFEDLANPTTNPDPNNPIWPPAGSARAVYMTSNGGPNGIMSVSASSNSFVNELNDPSYDYGLYFQDTVFYPSVAENWSYQLKQAYLAFNEPSTAMVASLPPLSNRGIVTVAVASGPAVSIDLGLGSRFMIVASDRRVQSGLPVLLPDEHYQILLASGAKPAAGWPGDDASAWITGSLRDCWKDRHRRNLAPERVLANNPPKADIRQLVRLPRRLHRSQMLASNAKPVLHQLRPW